MSSSENPQQHDYDEYADDGRFGKWFIITILLLSVSALLFFLPTKCTPNRKGEAAKTLSAEREAAKEKEINATKALGAERQLAKEQRQAEKEKVVNAPEQAIAQTKTPMELVRLLQTALSKEDLDQVSKLVPAEVFTAELKEESARLMSKGQLTPSTLAPLREVGQLEPNRRIRWAIPLKSDGGLNGGSLLVETQKNERARWEISALRLPQQGQLPDLAQMDSLEMTDAFLNAAQRQDFTTASQFVDSAKVSDVKIAGLCILFEEGQYRLASQTPLRAMIRKENLAAYLAKVEGHHSDEAAKFGLNLSRETGKHWKISEINLDNLLANFTNKQGGADVQYAPLVTNPAGGETLVIYFDFDSTELTPRLQRQLDIVSMILKGDATKQIKISGHADALGSDDYNTQLSAQRAQTVRSYLARVGVPESQVVTLAEGEARPLRPNTTETGEDDPSGRRANRRTEIYLDF